MRWGQKFTVVLLFKTDQNSENLLKKLVILGWFTNFVSGWKFLKSCELNLKRKTETLAEKLKGKLKIQLFDSKLRNELLELMEEEESTPEGKKCLISLSYLCIKWESNWFKSLDLNLFVRKLLSSVKKDLCINILNIEVITLWCIRMNFWF